MKKFRLILLIFSLLLALSLCSACSNVISTAVEVISLFTEENGETPAAGEENATVAEGTDEENTSEGNTLAGEEPVSYSDEGDALTDIEESYIATSAVSVEVDTAAETAVVANSAPAIPTVLMPVASGTTVYSNSKAAIDASNYQDGYVMIKYTGGSSVVIKVLLTGPSGITYIYDLNNAGTYEVYPLSDGSGNYSIGIYENISGTKYATAYTKALSVTLADEFAPFLRPNQYVNYSVESETVKKAIELCTGLTGELDKVSAVYNYIVSNFTYDKQLAATVTSGYLPNLDSVLAKKSGICFDYAALMTAMLRSQNVPTKLVIGYTGSVYHAWINVYVEGQGWVNGVICFDGEQWKLMDPTFASTGHSSSEIMQYIGNGANYTAKYFY